MAGRHHVTAVAPAAALEAFDAILAIDSTHFEANWRTSLALVDLGKGVPDQVRDARRDSLYALAERRARRAIATDSTRADGYFALANAVGKAVLTRGKREQMDRAGEVRTIALAALARDPSQDGAHHILGRWHLEIMRLPGIFRFMARKVLGQDLIGEASWEEGIRHLEAAVASRPDWIYHRLDLALAYADRGRFAEARAQITILDTLPLGDVLDTLYRRQAREVAATLRDR